MMIPEALATAVQHYHAGSLWQAEQLCGQILQVDPRHVGGLFLLGLIDRQLGRYDQAVEHLSQAVGLKPDFTEAHNSLGNALRALGRLEEAVASYRQALRLNPRLAEAHNNFGVALMELGTLEAAAASLQRALDLKPDYVEAHSNLGVVLTRQGKLEQAVASLRTALRLRPDHVEAHNNLEVALEKQSVRQTQQAPRVDRDDASAHNSRGAAFMEQEKFAEAAASFQQAVDRNPHDVDARNNLGVALARQGKFQEAVATLQHALRLKPDFAEARNNMGNALLEQGQMEEAVASFQQALRLKPDFADAHNSLGTALRDQGRFEEAAASFRRALQLKPIFPDAYSNLGVAVLAQGQVDEAVANYQQALRLRPNFPQAHRNLAMARLLLGDFEQGWREYEWRWQCDDFKAPGYRQPLWDGSPLKGQTILLHAEQGYGDTLQFVRYAELVRQHGGTVVVACPSELLRLVASCPGVDRAVPLRGPLPPFGVQAPLLSLPKILGTSLATVPAKVPYLFADAELAARWKRELGRSAGFKIGIAWQGRPNHRGDRQRSVRLAQFESLGRLDGVQLFSLQKGTGSEQLQSIGAGFAVTDVGGATAGDFMDTAAVMQNLDLVVTVDTAVAHLAGALGVPTWVALPFAPDWRWLLRREDSPWYPTLRLFRQKQAGDWHSVFQSMREAVGEPLAHQRSHMPR
jgi:tetratricopeptide (TPR) repeat protein